jgi:hypothetical protein
MCNEAADLPSGSLAHTQEIRVRMLRNTRRRLAFAGPRS